MIEILSPAGSHEAVIAAVQSGADAIYLGCGDFNARRNAANFTEHDLSGVVEYCHLRGTKVYLTMNTLLRDRELEKAAQTALAADKAGVDAVLVQDLGVLRMLRETVPQMPIHASTQMTIHSLDGAKFAADLGIERVVLSRELSRDQIAHICAHSPVEIEVFVHGALCMCYSGQCFMSSVIGGRSGNRGLCAQPCRLNYGWNGKADKPILSLKDMSLAGYLRELDEMGVACAKIEGRMKRPEYVAIVTKIYAAAVKEGREPTKEEMEMLRMAFSRQGFTDGYYLDKQGRGMFGVRKENETDPGPLFAKAKAEYQRGEHPKVNITLTGRVKWGEPVSVSVRDEDGHEAVAQGDIPEGALKREITAEEVEKQLSKTGGTPYLAAVRAEVDEGLALPLSVLNGLRRQALEDLSAQRTRRPDHARNPGWKLSPPVKGEAQAGAFVVSVEKFRQITPRLLELGVKRVDIPLEEAYIHREELSDILAKTEVAVTFPRVLWDREHPTAEKQLLALKEAGVTAAVVSTWGALALAKRLGFALVGGYGLGVGNSEAVRGLKELGLRSACVNFEQRLPRIRDLTHELPLEVIVYGRLPLMVMENCIIHNRESAGSDKGKQNTCHLACGRGKEAHAVNTLTDRKGAKFPVIRAYGCRNEILNSATLFLADKDRDYKSLGVELYQLRFTTESPEECVLALERYMNLNDWTPGEYTRGLYYREVE